MSNQATERFLARASAAVAAAVPGTGVTVEAPTPHSYRITLRRADRTRVAELYPGPENPAQAFEQWVARPDDDPLGLAAWVRALADRITGRPGPVSLAFITLTCARSGHRDLRRRFVLD